MKKLKRPQLRKIAEKYSLHINTINYYVNVLTYFQARALSKTLTEKSFLAFRKWEDKIGEFHKVRYTFINAYYMLKEEETEKKKKGNYEQNFETILAINEDYAN